MRSTLGIAAAVGLLARTVSGGGDYGHVKVVTTDTETVQVTHYVDVTVKNTQTLFFTEYTTYTFLYTVSLTKTDSATITNTRTDSTTVTDTDTDSTTITNTEVDSVTVTNTLTDSTTVTDTDTDSVTVTTTQTNSATVTNTETDSVTITNTETDSVTITETDTDTVTTTSTASQTITTWTTTFDPCPKSCSISAETVNLYFWPTNRPFHYPSTYVDPVRQYTFTSPSVYMYIPSAVGTNTLGQPVGPSTADWMLPLAIHQVSTIAPGSPNITRQLTLADLGTDCPKTADPTAIATMVDPHCDPVLAAPYQVRQWAYPCNACGRFGMFDPPYAVPPLSGSLVVTTGSAPPVVVTTPFTPVVPTATVTASSLPSVTVPTVPTRTTATTAATSAITTAGAGKVRSEVGGVVLGMMMGVVGFMFVL